MKCRQCSNELYIDHTELSEDGRVEKYIYVCVNPQCGSYRKAVRLTGEAAETTIREKA